MEGRFPRGGLFLTFANCADPAAEKDMNAWWEKVHVPDVTRAGIFHSATRYVNPRAACTPQDPKYLTIYETDWEDVQRAYAENTGRRPCWKTWDQTSRLHPALSIARKMLFRRHGRNPIAFAGAAPHGLLVNLSDCADPHREAEFDWFYDYCRSFDVLLTSLVSSVSRYANTSPADGQPKYLTLYETELPGYDALERIRRALDNARPRPDVAVTRYNAAFDLIYSESAARAGSGV